MEIPSEHVGAKTARSTVDALTFEDFFRREHPNLVSALCLITGSREEAEDIGQTAFMRVYERWDRVRAMERPDGFLYRVAMNEFRSGYRRAVRAARRAVLIRDPDDAFAAVEAQDVVIATLRKLRPRHRAAVVLTGLLEYSSEEAGRMLGLSPSTVRVLTTQARKTMRRLMEDPDD